METIALCTISFLLGAALAFYLSARLVKRVCEDEPRWAQRAHELWFES